jgi:cellulose synthase/poly-beta-1,6-N-acetylglucosamine synthase-like glycosyltransferase
MTETMTLTLPVLSVIVPVYNEERQLARVIEALLASKCPIGREWIFVPPRSSSGLSCRRPSSSVSAAAVACRWGSCRRLASLRICDRDRNALLMDIKTDRTVTFSWFGLASRCGSAPLCVHAVGGVTHVRVNASPTILSSKVWRGLLCGAVAHESPRATRWSVAIFLIHPDAMARRAPSINPSAVSGMPHPEIR